MRIAITLLLFVATVSLSAPVMPPGPMKEEPSPPVKSLPWIGGWKTSYGEIHQDGICVKFGGGGWSWLARGSVCLDNEHIIVYWSNQGCERAAFGRYRITDAGLKGMWGYEDELEFNEANEIVSGLTREEMIARQILPE